MNTKTLPTRRIFYRQRLSGPRWTFLRFSLFRPPSCIFVKVLRRSWCVMGNDVTSRIQLRWPLQGCTVSLELHGRPLGPTSLSGLFRGVPALDSRETSKKMKLPGERGREFIAILKRNDLVGSAKSSGKIRDNGNDATKGRGLKSGLETQGSVGNGGGKRTRSS